MVNQISYENIILSLAIIITIIIIYYIIITYIKHTNIVEKFSESQDKSLQENVKFRKCQIYFTEEKEVCDKKYDLDESDNCKYTYEGWKEIDTITNKDGKYIDYANKKYINNKLNEVDFTNVREETRCFNELKNGDNTNIDNKMIIDSKLYEYRDFNFDSFSGINDNICNVEYALKELLKQPNRFYKFILDVNNNIIDIKKGYFNDKQTNFIIDDTFTIDKFAESYGNGLEYSDINTFNIFKISKFPNINVKIYKLVYNYLCYQSQIINYSIVETKINLGKFLNITNQSKKISNSYINTNIKGINFSQYKNSNGKEDKFSQIIKGLNDKKTELIGEENERTKILDIELAEIKKSINDENIKDEFKITNFYQKYNAKEYKLWNKDDFLNQFKTFNYKKHYLTTNGNDINAVIKSNVNNIRTYIKNNFQKGFKYFKVDKYFGIINSTTLYAGSNYKSIFARIDHIRNKEDIKELHQDSLSEDLTDFRNLSTLTKGKQIINRDSTYSMLFQGYFYAHEQGNYRFGIISDDASYIFINDELLVSNGQRHSMVDKNANKSLKKGDLCKIDIYFGEFHGGDNLVIYWESIDKNSGRIYNANWDNKTWIFHNKPSYKTSNSNNMPNIEINGEKYVDGRELAFSHKNTNDSSRDIYYEFKNSNLIYDVIAQNDMEIRLLIIGGGGGGGMDMGGGGGAGGFIEEVNIKISKDDIISIDVGKGGNGAPEGGTNQQGINNKFKLGARNGENTIVKIMDKIKNIKNEYVAYGGGYGGSSNQENAYKSSMGINGGDGGSGGGSGGNYIGNDGKKGKAGKAIYSSMKNIGNNGKDCFAKYSAGGGGGAGILSKNEDGGDGKISDITGESIYFAGGGGGAGYTNKGGNGGIGGGGGAPLVLQKVV